MVFGAARFQYGTKTVNRSAKYIIINCFINRGGGLEIVMLILSLLAIVLAPLAATLVQLAISRQREFLADASSVELTRNPQGMINALLKLDNSEPMQRHVDDASSALFINDPKKESGLQKLFYTHPPIAERVARLRKM